MLQSYVMKIVLVNSETALPSAVFDTYLSKLMSFKTLGNKKELRTRDRTEDYDLVNMLDVLLLLRFHPSETFEIYHLW